MSRRLVAVRYPDPNREDPPWRAARTPVCPYCGAPSGAHCTNRRGAAVHPHTARVRIAMPEFIAARSYIE